MRILVKPPGAPVYWPSSVLASKKDADEATGEFFGDLIERHLPPRSSRTFHREIIPIVDVILQQATDDQSVDRHPDGSPPVGIAAEHAGVRFRGQIVNSILLITDINCIRMLRVMPR